MSLGQDARRSLSRDWMASTVPFRGSGGPLKYQWILNDAAEVAGNQTESAAYAHGKYDDPSVGGNFDPPGTSWTHYTQTKGSVLKLKDQLCWTDHATKTIQWNVGYAAKVANTLLFDRLDSKWRVRPAARSSLKEDGDKQFTLSEDEYSEIAVACQRDCFKHLIDATQWNHLNDLRLDLNDDSDARRLLKEVTAVCGWSHSDATSAIDDVMETYCKEPDDDEAFKSIMADVQLFAQENYESAQATLYRRHVRNTTDDIVDKHDRNTTNSSALTSTQRVDLLKTFLASVRFRTTMHEAGRGVELADCVARSLAMVMMVPWGNMNTCLANKQGLKTFRVCGDNPTGVSYMLHTHSDMWKGEYVTQHHDALHYISYGTRTTEKVRVKFKRWLVENIRIAKATASIHGPKEGQEVVPEFIGENVPMDTEDAGLNDAGGACQEEEAYFSKFEQWRDAFMDDQTFWQNTNEQGDAGVELCLTMERSTACQALLSATLNSVQAMSYDQLRPLWNRLRNAPVAPASDHSAGIMWGVVMLFYASRTLRLEGESKNDHYVAIRNVAVEGMRTKFREVRKLLRRGGYMVIAHRRSPFFRRSLPRWVGHHLTAYEEVADIRTLPETEIDGREGADPRLDVVPATKALNTVLSFFGSESETAENLPFRALQSMYESEASELFVLVNDKPPLEQNVNDKRPREQSMLQWTADKWRIVLQSLDIVSQTKTIDDMSALQARVERMRSLDCARWVVQLVTRLTNVDHDPHVTAAWNELSRGSVHSDTSPSSAKLVIMAQQLRSATQKKCKLTLQVRCVQRLVCG